MIFDFPSINNERFYPFLHERDSYLNPVNKRYPWHKEIITIHAKIDRIVSDSTVILVLNGKQYDEFMSMKGSFVCTDGHGEERLFTLRSNDVVQIIESNYDNVYNAWEDKREKYRQLLIEQNKAKEEQRAEDQRKQKEAEEAERMSHFWYRLLHKKKKPYGE